MLAPAARELPRDAADPSMTLSEAVLWMLGGGIVLAAAVMPDVGLAAPELLRGIGALGVVIGAALLVALRRGGASRRVLECLAYLGTVLVTVTVVAGGEVGVLFIPLYGFVAVVAAIHMSPSAATRHVAAVVAAVVGLVLLDAISTVHAAVFTAVVVVMAAVVGDVTRRGAETVERHRQQEAWRAAMLGALAHDIRSPLGVVRGALQTVVLNDGDLDDQTRVRLLEAADRHAARIETLSTDLLAIERVRHGQLALEVGSVSAADVLQRVAALHDDELHLDVPDDLQVWADEGRLVQILVNLVRNAVAHGAPPVEVRVAAQDGGIVFEVRDHGAGVPQELRRTLFDGFVSDGAAGSIGLGLWIVRGLTEAHGGRIGVRPADPGARFTVWLPSEPVDSVARRGLLSYRA